MLKYLLTSMALTADVLLEVEFPAKGDIIEVDSDVADTLYKGALVNFNADGKPKVAADVATEVFAGIVIEQVIIGTSAVGVKILRNTKAWIPHAGAAQTDIGALFHASADDTLSDGAGVNVAACGKCVGYEAGKLLIDFSDRAL